MLCTEGKDGCTAVVHKGVTSRPWTRQLFPGGCNLSMRYSCVARWQDRGDVCCKCAPQRGAATPARAPCMGSAVTLCCSNPWTECRTPLLAGTCTFWTPLASSRSETCSLCHLQCEQSVILAWYQHDISVISVQCWIWSSAQYCLSVQQRVIIRHLIIAG
jgi:hypothetical protein